MGFGAFKLPTGEYRFTGEHLSVGPDQKVYIDASTWCIHGEYEAFGKYIVTRSNVTAHLAQVHPFTLGWISDLHVSSGLPDSAAWTEAAREQVDRLALCNPSLTVFGGDVVSGSGGYTGDNFGLCPPIEAHWFETVWNASKDTLSNTLWVKGNHDIDPNCYHYYDWFERLWCLGLGRFKLIGFDTYYEQTILPGSCEPVLSLPDAIWLKKRLNEDRRSKVILAHAPLDQWHKYAPWAFEKTSNVKCALGGHVHKLSYTEVADIPVYINGTCSDPNYKPHAATLTTLTKDGEVHVTLTHADLEVNGTSDNIEIHAPKTIDWNREEVEGVIPVRVVKRFNGHLLNLIVCCSSERTVRVEIRRKTDTRLEITSDAALYALGKEIGSKKEPYDAWSCACGTRWNCYRADPEEALEVSIRDSG
jgi:predicted phosphodiesterase